MHDRRWQPVEFHLVFFPAFALWNEFVLIFCHHPCELIARTISVFFFAVMSNVYRLLDYLTSSFRTFFCWMTDRSHSSALYTALLTRLRCTNDSYSLASYITLVCVYSFAMAAVFQIGYAIVQATCIARHSQSSADNRNNCQPHKSGADHSPPNAPIAGPQR